MVAEMGNEGAERGLCAPERPGQGGCWGPRQCANTPVSISSATLGICQQLPWQLFLHCGRPLAFGGLHLSSCLGAAPGALVPIEAAKLLLSVPVHPSLSFTSEGMKSCYGDVLFFKDELGKCREGGGCPSDLSPIFLLSLSIIRVPGQTGD